MELGQIMHRLEQSTQTAQAGVKTAAAPSNGTGSSPDILRETLRATLSGTEKTAAAAGAPVTPVGDLLKIAEDLSGAEHEHLLKLAHMYGAAHCDGFMERFAQYEAAALQVAPPQVKTAAAQAAAAAQPQQVDQAIETIKTAAADPEFVKFAEAHPDLVKEAYTLGYQRQWEGLVKQAQDDFERGYGETMEEVHKLASDCYRAGAVTINDVLRQASAQRQQ
jgi:hypothetical protein